MLKPLARGCGVPDEPDGDDEVHKFAARPPGGPWNHSPCLSDLKRGTTRLPSQSIDRNGHTRPSL